MTKLYQPVQIGAVHLDHRIVQAPLTRLRSYQPSDVPNAMMVKYYAQRASKGGLQIAEATPVAIQGRGYLGAPGIYNDEQVEGWRKVVEAVHAKGGVIFLQLWHVGRQSHVSLTGGVAPARTVSHSGSGLGLHQGRLDQGVVEPCARNRGDQGNRRAVPPGRDPRQGGRIRWRRNPWRQRLSDRPIPSGRFEQAHRRLWRGDRETHPPSLWGGRKRSPPLGGRAPPGCPPPPP